MWECPCATSLHLDRLLLRNRLFRSKWLLLMKTRLLLRRNWLIKWHPCTKPGCVNHKLASVQLIMCVNIQHGSVEVTSCSLLEAQPLVRCLGCGTTFSAGASRICDHLFGKRGMRACIERWQTKLSTQQAAGAGEAFIDGSTIKAAKD